MGESEQQLFLIEFLIDRVNVPSIRAMHTDNVLPVTTCVTFQILNLEPINIYQESTVENCTCNGDDTQVFKKGKSCLFALPTMVLEKPLQSFPINMSVYKKLPPGVLPDIMLIGTHQIEAKDRVNALLNRHIFKVGNPRQSIKDTYTIKTATGQRVGEVTVFIRISCCGKKIVTQFQMPRNKKPYLFKGSDNSPVFQCKRIESNLEERVAPISCTCNPTRHPKSQIYSTEESTKAPTCHPPPCPPPTRQNILPEPIDFIYRPCCSSGNHHEQSTHQRN